MDSSPPQQPQLASKLPRPLSRLPLPKSSVPNLRHAASASIDKARTTSTINLRAAANAPPKPRAPLVSTQPNNRVPIHTQAFSTASTTSQDGLFKKPVPRPLSRLPPKTRPVSISSTKGVVNDDELASVSSLRTDSRASSQDNKSYSGLSPKRDGPTTPVLCKASRPSLSERTIESLALIPPSPAIRRRKSSFFAPDSPMAPLSPPESSVGYNSRPTSQDGGVPPGPLFTPKSLPPKVRGVTIGKSTATPTSKRSVSTAVRARSPTKASLLKAAEKDATTYVAPKVATRGPIRGTKTVSGRMQQARPALSSVFTPPAPAVSKPASKPLLKRVAKKPVVHQEEVAPSSKAAQASKSSASLREQIRAAKAARASLGAHQGKPSEESAEGFDLNAHADPFNVGPKDGRSMVQKRVDIARTEGRLNIAAMNLKEIPVEVLKMYDSEFNKDSEIPWNEVVDLVRFIAADNEIETIADDAFPDVDPENWDEEVKGSQFGGLEVLDLHGNVLFDVPMGLKRLGCLTTLNLSRNRLMNDALETITQITTLRELKIADNLLTGDLSSIDLLSSLEVLDVSGNKLSLLPDELGSLSKLRILNVSNNQLTSLPTNQLSQIPGLVEIHAGKNRLSGAFFTMAGTAMPRLQILDISINSINTLYDGSAGPELPALHTLNMSFNQITSLPDLSSWTSLTSLLAEDNHLSEFPLGFTESNTLKLVDLTGNNLTKLDEGIAKMDSLETLRIGGNSIRERKFLSMGVEEIKRDLRARMGPVSFME
ncbi:L domain-like protein [Venturia nashicola]|uniref:L domain-like protein n=1 Tax=Venturia nashicola TaxID=86259 RepID=A0A4Z1PRN1_9PEZI|nr:L domain-like protein [Venturia nashicola]TLD37594.1 L domain-like protein [Venturia nashicola]